MILIYITYAFPETEDHIKHFKQLEVLACLNLAQCKLKTQQFVEAIEHASAALSKALAPSSSGNPDFRSAILAYYRRSQAHAHRSDYDLAKADLSTMKSILDNMCDSLPKAESSSESSFYQRFSAKYHRQLSTVKEMQSRHTRRARYFSQKMFHNSTGSTGQLSETQNDNSKRVKSAKVSGKAFDAYVKAFVRFSLD